MRPSDENSCLKEVHTWRMVCRPFANLRAMALQRERERERERDGLLYSSAEKSKGDDAIDVGTDRRRLLLADGSAHVKYMEPCSRLFCHSSRLFFIFSLKCPGPSRLV